MHSHGDLFSENHNASFFLRKQFNTYALFLVIKKKQIIKEYCKRGEERNAVRISVMEA